MAQKSNRKPRSLNDNHNRFLQGFSADPKPSLKLSDKEEMLSEANNERRCRLFAAENSMLAHFSAITDFDSSPDKEEKRVNDIEDVDVPEIFGLNEVDFQHEQEKVLKVKMEGRRRLCKISAENNNDAKNIADSPKLYDLTDFDSPALPPKNAANSDNNYGRNEIRDILNDLSAKFDVLSIERKAKTEKPVEETSALVKGNEVGKEKVVDFPGYTDLDVSFSLTRGSCESSSDAATSGSGGVEILEEGHTKEIYISLSEAEEEGGFSNLDSKKKFVGRACGSEGHNEPKLQPQRLNKKLAPVTKSTVADEYDDEVDDCVIVGGKKLLKDAGRQHRKLEVKNDRGATDVPEDEGSIILSSSKCTYKLPGNIGRKLYPHQQDGLRWLWSLHCMGKGGILGDDMGLGKTMQICGFLAGLFHSKLIRRAMVVAPQTLLHHWLKELSVVGLSSKTREYFGTNVKAREYELRHILEDKGVLLTTYDIVRNNSKSLRGDYFYSDECSDGFVWDYVILDEGHLIKNPSTQRAKSLLQIPSAHRIIISGTPLQNNLKELWALFNFCCPELLGDNTWFKAKFESAILRGNDKNASDREKRVGSTVAKELRDRIQPYFLRRLKSEVFNQDNDKKSAKLSKKNEIIVWLRLTSCQQQLYEAFLKSELVLSAFDGSPLAALTILKKICDHPLLLTKRAAEDVLEGMDSMLHAEEVHVAEKLAMHVADVSQIDDFEEKHDVSCKISFILSLLDNLIPKGHHVLIFSQTRKMLNLIQESLISKGHGFLRIDGTTKASDRMKTVNDFQEGMVAPIFLLTSQVGGLGLTLTRADRVIVVDPAWNPSTDNQSVDRAYRIGQKKDVLVYRLMTCGTVEEKIYRKQVFKGGLFRTATEHKEQVRYFSQQDLRELFSLPKQGFDVSLTQQQLDAEHDCRHTMDDSLKAHIEFLKCQGIAGVSHHSLLFSKATPVPLQDSHEDEEEKRQKSVIYRGSSSSTSSLDCAGADLAFNPKDVKLSKKSPSPDSDGKLTESEIKLRIKRLSQTLLDKGLVSRLPDKGEKLHRQLAELNSELDKIKMAEKVEVVVLNILSEEFQRVLNV